MMIMILVTIKRRRGKGKYYLSKHSYVPSIVLYALSILLSNLEIIILILQMKNEDPEKLHNLYKVTAGKHSSRIWITD